MNPACDVHQPAVAVLRHSGLDALVLLIATCCAYLGVVQNGFVEFDDNIYVIYNAHTAAGLSADGWKYAWTTFDSGNWIPLTWLSYQLDATLFGMRPLGFHLTNVVLHAINVVLIYAWLRRTTGARWRGLVVAAIFAVHPLHVESVAWIAERKDVLSTFWLLVALHTYERYAARSSLMWYLATIIAFALGLLSKSMVVTFPVLLLIVDFWPLQRCVDYPSSDYGPPRYDVHSMWRLILEKVPLLLMSGAVSIVTIAAARSSKAFASIAISERVANALQSYCWYIGKTLTPVQLCVLYPLPLNVDWRWTVAGGILLLGITCYVLVQRVRRPVLVFGWAWFLVSLLPVIGLLQVGSQAHADRYSYIPHVGLLTLLVWEGQYLLSLLPGRRKLTVFVVATVLTASAWLTANQVRVWHSTETLWRQALVVDPNNWYAHGVLGHLCLESGDLDEAEQHFRTVIDYRPEERASLKKLVEIYRKYPGSQRNTAAFLAELGRQQARDNNMPSAVMLFRRALAIEPNHLAARNNLALALSQLGDDREAEIQLKIVLSKAPDDANAHVNLGMILERSNRLDEAREQFRAAVKLNPADEDARDRLKQVDQRLKGTAGH